MIILPVTLVTLVTTVGGQPVRRNRKSRVLILTVDALMGHWSLAAGPSNTTILIILTCQ